MQIVRRRELKCMMVKITCEEWKRGGNRRHRKLKKIRKVNGENKRCRQCPREKMKHMRRKIRCEGVK